MASQKNLSVKQLAGAVDKAVKLAADRHKLQFDSPYTINGLINGRTLRAAAQVDLNAVRQAAQDITDQVAGAAGPGATAAATIKQQFQPAVLILPRLILCGFIPPINDPLEIDVIGH
jgi:hypothetical protein